MSDVVVICPVGDPPSRPDLVEQLRGRGVQAKVEVNLNADIGDFETDDGWKAIGLFPAQGLSIVVAVERRGTRDFRERKALLSSSITTVEDQAIGARTAVRDATFFVTIDLPGGLGLDGYEIVEQVIGYFSDEHHAIMFTPEGGFFDQNGPLV